MTEPRKPAGKNEKKQPKFFGSYMILLWLIFLGGKPSTAGGLVPTILDSLPAPPGCPKPTQRCGKIIQCCQCGPRYLQGSYPAQGRKQRNDLDAFSQPRIPVVNNSCGDWNPGMGGVDLSSDY